MSDEKSLAVAYNVKRRSKKGELTHGPAQDEFSPRKERLKQMLMQGGEVEAQDAHEESYDIDQLFPETDVIEDAPDIEISPEDKRKERLKGILSNFEMKK